jgi:uncharacterized membrane protein
MMTWYGAHGWGWCGSIFSMFGMAVLWVVVVGATVLAIHFLIRGRSNPSVMTVTRSTRDEGLPPVRFVRGDMDDDKFYRRLM